MKNLKSAEITLDTEEKIKLFHRLMEKKRPDKELIEKIRQVPPIPRRKKAKGSSF